MYLYGVFRDRSTFTFSPCFNAEVFLHILVALTWTGPGSSVKICGQVLASDVQKYKQPVLTIKRKFLLLR